MARPPDDPANPRSTTIGFRTSEALRNRLDAARREIEPGEKPRPRTLSEEIERRLTQSFEIDQKIEALFGGPFMFALFRILAEQVIAIENETDECWTKNRFAYDQVKDCIDALLEHFRPPGRSRVPEGLVDEYLTERGARSMGKTFARDAIAILEMARRGRHGKFAAYLTSARIVTGRLKKSPLTRLGDYAEDVVKAPNRRRTE